MRGIYSTVEENGYDYVLKAIKELQEEGYEIISGPEEAMVSRGEDSNGNPIFVPGYRIVVDDGRFPQVMTSRQEIPF